MGGARPIGGGRFWRVLALAGACAIGGVSPRAIGTDLQVRRWGNEEGLPQSWVESLCQTRDGRLLLGTRAGLVRFDGLEFETLEVLGGQAWPPDRSCTALLEDETGRIWIGTKQGLYCWQAGTLERFTHSDGLGADGILCLISRRQGGLWIGTDAGLTQWQAGRFQTHRPRAIGAGFVRAMCEDGTGRVWLGTPVGLYVFDPRSEDFTEVWAVPPDRSKALRNGIESLVFDNQGRLWFGTATGMGCVALGRDEIMLVPTDSKAGSWPSAVRVLRKGGTVLAISDDGIRQLEGDRWLRAETGRHWAGVGIRCALVDREENLWLGTANDGLWRLAARPCRAISLLEGPGPDPAWSVCEAGEGGVWVGADSGVYRVEDARVTKFTVHPETQGAAFRSVFEDRDGSLWLGSSDRGLFYYRRRSGVLEGVALPAMHHQVQAIQQDADGWVWIGYKAGLRRVLPRPVGDSEFDGDSEPVAEQWMFRPDETRCLSDGQVWVGRNDFWRLEGDEEGRRYRKEELLSDLRLPWAARIPAGSLSTFDIHCVIADRTGAIWFGTHGGGLNRLRNGRFESWTVAQGLPGNIILAIREDRGGNLWLGSAEGLTLWREDFRMTLTSAHGLPDNLVNQIVEDQEGNLWLGCHQGVIRVEREELDAVVAGRLPRLRCVLLGRAEGLPAGETNGEVQPAGCASRDGRLWFPTIRGLGLLDPAAVPPPSPPAPVIIQSVRATDRLIADSEVPGAAEPPQVNETTGPSQTLSAPGEKPALRLPAGSGRYVEFRYGSFNLSHPEGTRYRYQLEGHDPDWIDAGAQRTATYAKLAPGAYRFRVIARNQQGIWSDPETGLDLVLAPLWYQSVWSRAAGGLLLVVGGVTLHRRRMKLARLESENRLARERARIGRDLHDDLGAWLARAQMVLSRLRGRMPATGEWKAQLADIEESVRAGQQTMREVIWAVNPDNDTVEGLGARIAAFAQEYLAPLGVRCRLDLPDVWPPGRVSAELRQMLLLTTKEAIRNAIEHGRASEVRLSLRLEAGRLVLAVADDGCGLSGSPGDAEGTGLAGPSGALPATGSRRGDGLENIRKRVETLHGRATLSTGDPVGFRLQVSVPLSP